MTAKSEATRWVAKTQTKLATVLGVNRRTVADWATRPGFPTSLPIPGLWAVQQITGAGHKSTKLTGPLLVKRDVAEVWT